MSSDCIESFVYHYNSTHNSVLAKHVTNICKSKLSNTGIEALFTYRAKERDSLRKKLEKRNAERRQDKKPEYASEKDIKNDIVDLAGVRIALYFPDQTEQVIEMIKSAFEKVEIVAHPPDDAGALGLGHGASGASKSKSQGQKKHPAHFEEYAALHARVRLWKEQAEGLSDWRPDDVVEIQVVSVLVHAWAQVTHDITYKSLFEAASDDENDIIRIIRAQIGVAELMLNQLHQKYLDRTKENFRTTSRLGEYLVRRTDEECMTSDSDDGRLGMLLKFLKKTKYDSPEKLGPILNGMGFDKSTDNPGTNVNHWTKILERYKPFQPPRAARIPFCIIDRILTMHPRQRHEDLSPSEKLEIILSALCWLKQLPDPNSDFVGLRAWSKAHRNEVKNDAAFNKWPFIGPMRCEILRGKAPSEADQKNIDINWEWFEKGAPTVEKGDPAVGKGTPTAESPIFSFVFRLAEIGVRKDFSQGLRDLDQDYDAEIADLGSSQGSAGASTGQGENEKEREA
ncbi:MAG: hypothetical protein M1820_010045 [Bogoriella megaspora]|nr:MAG: hypothetical protein M1820_010045 [Bogoriella megaspora]